MGNPEKAALEDIHGGGREVRPGESWFTMETSPTKRQALFRLEKEMETILLFEHRGSCKAIPL